MTEIHLPSCKVGVSIVEMSYEPQYTKIKLEIQEIDSEDISFIKIK